MKKLFHVFSIFLILIVSCNKIELPEIYPTIQLKISNGYIFSDTSISAGKQFTVGIIAKSENGENLTNLIVESNGERFIDKGFNSAEFTEDIQLTKSLDETETIDFIIRNKARKADTITIRISKFHAAFSAIIRYRSIVMGAQDNISSGNFFSFINGQLYTQNQAFNNQQFIDMVYYFDSNGDANTLASPGANLTGIIVGTDSPEFWIINRTTYYSREPLSIVEEEFNAASNDSLIVANLFSGGGRKAKLLQNAQYYGFQTIENKFGIIKIEIVTGQAEGSIQFTSIIQQ